MSPYTLFGGIAVLALALSLYTNVFGRRLNVALLYRAIMAVLIVSFMIIPYLGGSSFAGVAAAAVTACYDCFDIVVWALMANVVALSSASAVTTFAWGRLSNHLGMLVGVVLGLAVESAGEAAGGAVADGTVAGTAAGASLMAQGIATTAVVLVLVLCVMASMREVDFFTTSPAIVGRMSSKPQAEAAALDELCREYGLTPREREVFELLARGRNASYVAETLVISDNTAKTHAKHIYKKLGVNTQQQLMDLVEKAQIAQMARA